jgi:hypothetical protein
MSPMRSTILAVLLLAGCVEQQDTRIDAYFACLMSHPHGYTDEEWGEWCGEQYQLAE